MKTRQTCLVAFLGARQNDSQNTRVVNKLTLATGRTAQLRLPHIRAFVNNAQKSETTIFQQPTVLRQQPQNKQEMKASDIPGDNADEAFMYSALN